MKILKVIDEIEREFCAVLECENCKQTQIYLSSFDADYNKRILPIIKCRVCGKSGHDIVREENA